MLTGTGDRAFCAGMDLRAFAAGERIAAGAQSGLAALPAAARRRGRGARSSARPTRPPWPAGSSCCSAATSSWPRRRPCFGLPEVKRGLFAAGERHGARHPRSRWRRPGADPHRRQHHAPSGPTSSAWSTRSSRPTRCCDAGRGAGRADRRRTRRSAWRRPRSSCGSTVDRRRPGPARLRRVAGRRVRQRGRQGGSHRLRREARPRLAGPLTCRAARVPLPTGRPRSSQVEDVAAAVARRPARSGSRSRPPP